MSTSGPSSFPPPPPDLTPPPGYVGYKPGLAGSLPLQRVQKLRTALLVLLAVVAVGNLIVLATIPSQVDAAREYINDRDEDKFVEQQAGALIAQLLVVATTIAIAVLTLIWLYRIAKNHRALGRQGTWGPGWAIGGWFLPPFFYVIPTLTLREHWRASNPEIPPGDDGWRAGPEPFLVYLWFVLYSVVVLALNIANTSVAFSGFGGDVDEQAQSIVDGKSLNMALAAVSALAAVAWFLVVRGLTERHTALTGERANAPR